MEIGLLTAPFGQESLEQVVAFAGEAGITALEVAAGPGSKQIDPAQLSDKAAADIRALLERSGVHISSLSYYANIVDPDADRRAKILAHLNKTVDAAAALGVSVVCTLAGHPLPGQDRMKTIEEEMPRALGPVLEHAAEKGIRIAFENWYATNIQNLEHWQRVFEVLPNENLGLNFDPSHLAWQGIDYLAAVEEFRTRIFHTHAKDVEINDQRLRRAGCLAGGWWRYVIPGFGRIRWGEFIGALRRIGYDGVISIEHEDRAFSREAGFKIGAKYLSQYI